ncbi:uncharacterized protein LTR77_001266 [Saxophila tyrrhenica]|uniref:Heterokaryon incompatibility domain-containing protein n=1 Tax=Saxophila tyrrhenica TaxID=1690608 RepID=A0AAV9PMT4_9PEZI|nr:hypothetical protein LTR77_001266 [Saxophila tyrrhenica]
MTNDKGRVHDLPILYPIRQLPQAGPQDPWGADPSLVTHHGIFCEGSLCFGSGNPIHGMRYNCSQCLADFCDRCVRQPNDHHDKSHILLECPGPCEFDVINVPRIEVPDFADVNGRELTELDLLSLESSDNGPRKPYLDDNPGTRDEPKEIEPYKYLDTQLYGTNAASEDSSAKMRLVHLHAGKDEEPLVCTLAATTIDDAPHFEAVSLSWHKIVRKTRLASITSEERLETVYIGDNHFLDASPELCTALRALRRPNAPRILFIDELCINRMNSAEWDFQNRAIGLIYYKAEKTIVYAADTQDATSYAFVLFDILAQTCHPGERSWTPEDFHGDPEKPSVDDSYWQEGWQELFRLFPQPILDKRCELHDAAFAKAAVFQCGRDEQRDWGQAVAVARMLSQDEWIAAAATHAQSDS